MGLFDSAKDKVNEVREKAADFVEDKGESATDSADSLENKEQVANAARQTEDTLRPEDSPNN